MQNVLNHHKILITSYLNLILITSYLNLIIKWDPLDFQLAQKRGE